MLINDGIISQPELAPILPTDERLQKGPVAIIECIQDIPCDPCVSSCPSKAITMKAGITDKPALLPDLCVGCGICIASCPGLAIFVVNMKHSERYAALSLPYEMIPVPKAGDIVVGLDRTGKEACEAKVLRVNQFKKYDRTHVVTLEVPKALAMSVRAFRMRPSAGKGK